MAQEVIRFNTRLFQCDADENNYALLAPITCFRKQQQIKLNKSALEWDKYSSKYQLISFLILFDLKLIFVMSYAVFKVIRSYHGQITYIHFTIINIYTLKENYSTV